jgi:hypothetical protein
MKRANEIQLVAETLKGHAITEEQLVELQNEFGPKWSEHGAFLDLTDEHFVKQLRRPENKHNPISFSELRALLERFTYAHQDCVLKLTHNSYGVIKEEQVLTNLVFFIDYKSRHGYDKDIRMVTAMRKNDFSTSDPVYEIELQ